MVGKYKLLACTSLCAVVMLMGTAAFAGTAGSGPSNAELQQEIDTLQQELQQTQMKIPQPVEAAKPASGWWDNTSISGRVYYDLSWVRNEVAGKIPSAGAAAIANGVGFDIKRAYLGVDHKFNDTYSANVTTDFQYNSTLGATELFIKKAYLQAKYSDAFTIRLGAADMPWIPFVEDIYGYRFVENTLIDRTKYGTSSDWGVHALGKLAGGALNYQVSVINGAGYKVAPGTGSQEGHFKSVDVEGRVNLNVSDFVFGVGGYYGKLGKDQQGASDHHTASRLDGLAAYKTSAVRLGFEYFLADNYNSVLTAGKAERAEGYGGFASYQFDPMWSIFGRYDYVEPDQTNVNRASDTAKRDNYFNIGLDYSPAKIVDFALVYKHDAADDGVIATQNGTIGGSSLTTDGKYDEVGLFGQLRF